MNNLLHTFREYPAVAGISAFVAISGVLALLLTVAMHRAGVSLKPLVFLFGFFAIVGGPQAIVHLLDARAHAVAARKAAPATVAAPAPSSGRVSPISWDKVFGADADPSLISDPRRGLDYIFFNAVDARLSFRPGGESAVAARFPGETEALAALDRYGTFFQFAQATGSDETGWSARRFGGTGEWTHVVAAGPELYAWSGPTREGVEARRVEALGPIPAVDGPRRAAIPGVSRTRVSTRLSTNTPIMTAFLLINVALATGWFFKASAWSARTPAQDGVAVLDVHTLRERLLAINQDDVPVDVAVSDDGRTIEINWRYADARWFDLMRAHRMKRAHRLVLTLDESSRMVRVREYMSAFDASAGPDGLRLGWRMATGIQFFQVEHRRVFGAQLDEQGRPTGELSKAWTFDLQGLKRPVIDAVTAGGWTWQPVVWGGPAWLRWLTG